MLILKWNKRITLQPFLSHLNMCTYLLKIYRFYKENDLKYLFFSSEFQFCYPEFNGSKLLFFFFFDLYKILTAGWTGRCGKTVLLYNTYRVSHKTLSTLFSLISQLSVLLGLKSRTFWNSPANSLLNKVQDLFFSSKLV